MLDCALVRNDSDEDEEPPFSELFASVTLGLLHPGGNRLRGRLELARQRADRTSSTICRRNSGGYAIR